MALHILVYDNYMFNTVYPHKAVSSLRSCANKQFHPNGKKQRLYPFRARYSKGVSNHHLYLVETQMKAREERKLYNAKNGRVRVGSNWNLLAWGSRGEQNRSGASYVTSLENMFGFLVGPDLETEAKNREAGTHRPSPDHSWLIVTDCGSEFFHHM